MPSWRRSHRYIQNMRHPIISILIPLLLYCLHSPSVSAVDLQCANLDVPRFRIGLDSNLTLAHGAGEWCCPKTHPIYGSSYISKWPNPPEYRYADATGIPFTKFPACYGCGNDEHVCETIDGVLNTLSSYVCCPSNYTCGFSDRKCYGTSQDGRATVVSGNAHILEVAAVPVADFDLCRFHVNGSGRGDTNATLVEGSPCNPLFKCEAFSQSQFRCTTCADPRYSPAGVCKIFTCPAGRFCSNITNAYGAAPFVVTDTLCPIGSYCPVNSTEPIICRAAAGEFCPYAGMASPENCNSWTGVATYCPLNCMNKVPCPVGYYCSAFAIPHPCPADEYSDVVGLFQCNSCNSAWYTSDSGATKCSKLKPLPIALICLAVLLCIASIYIVWFLSRRGPRKLLHAIQREADREAAETREKVIAAHEAQLAAAAVNVVANKRKKAEAIRFQFQQECARIKAALLERFMVDFRVELHRSAQGLSIISEQSEGSMTFQMEQGGLTPTMAVSIEGDMLRSYELLVSDSLAREFDTFGTPAAQVIRFMAEQPESVCPRDFDQTLRRINPLILAALPTFLKRLEVDESNGNEGATQLNEAIKQAEVTWAQELQQHMSLWLKQHGVAKKYSPSPSYNQSTAEPACTASAPVQPVVEVPCSNLCSRRLFQPLPPTYRPTLFPLTDESALSNSVRRTRLPRSANSSPPLLDSSGSASPLTPSSAPSAPSLRGRASTIVQIDEHHEEVHHPSEPQSLSSVRIHLSD